MFSLRNVFLVLGAVAYIVLVAVIIHLSTKNPNTYKSFKPSNYTPIVIELLPDRQVKIVQGEAEVAFSQRTFNKLQYKLEECFERRPDCHIIPTSTNNCSYVANVVGIWLCMDDHKRVLGGRIRAVILHREDLLQIYEL